MADITRPLQMKFTLDAAQKTALPEQALETYRDLESALARVLGSLDQNKIDALLAVLGNSNFLARWARRYPEKVAEILTLDLQQPYDAVLLQKDFGVKEETLFPLKKESLSERLLEFKYRHLFRISLRDLGFAKPLAELAAEFSALARSILQSALDWHLHQVRQNLGLTKIPFTILGLGKLGGNELNFSSDVDLIYFYGSDEGKILSPDGRGQLTPHEYFSKLAERLTAFLQQKTSEGFLYRVDLELRPEGKAGPLTNSVDAMEQYYESFGADWEKQAMIRASLASGDAVLCQDFLKRIHPFVFPKTTDFSFLKNLKKMKEKIEQAIHAHSQNTFHLKLGEGGIREVEFFVQSLQLLFGGQIPSLQTAHTLEALQRLQEVRLIDAREEEALRHAYIFLRTMEHRLQLVEEQQIYHLPSSSEELGHLARRMGFADPDLKAAIHDMQEELQLHRYRVKKIFEELLSTRFEEK